MVQLTKYFLCHEISGCVIRSATWSFTAVGQIAPPIKTYLTPSLRQIPPPLVQQSKIQPFSYPLSFVCTCSIIARSYQKMLPQTFLWKWKGSKNQSHTPVALAELLAIFTKRNDQVNCSQMQIWHRQANLTDIHFIFIHILS
jgi:hypothetical protein